MDAASPELSLGPSLLGRDHELATLAELVREARAQRGGAALVIGEPGIGKTALVSKVATRAHSDGALVLWGRCSGLGDQPAWGPIAQALGALFDQKLVDRSTVLSAGGGLLAMLPDASELAPELVAPVGADPETIAFAVGRGAARLLRRVCLERPTVLVVDDVHDADRASLRLLVRIAQDARTMALAVLLTAREGELGVNPAANEIAELSRDVTVVRVGALGAAPSRALVERVAPKLSTELVGRVLSVAEGNPLYLSELAALLSARVTVSGPELPIPLGIKASIRSRLERLPLATRGFVDALAVLGGQAPLERIAEIAGVPVAAAAPAFEVGLANVSSSRQAKLAHPLVLEVAYAEIAGEARALLHARAAENAKARALGGDPEAAIEQVRHLATGGAAATAIEVALTQARDAELGARDEEAVSVLRVAASALPAEGTGQARVDDRLRAELRISLTRAELRSGRTSEGIASAQEAARLAEATGDPDLLARAALARGCVFRYGHVDRGLVDALRRAVERREGREDALQARLLARLAAAEQPSSEPRKPIERAYRAFSLARQIGDENVLLDVLHDGMAALVDIEDPKLRMRPNRELYELARRLRAPWYELRALNRLVFDYAEMGDVENMEACIEGLDVLARAFAHPRHQWRVALLRAARAASSGRWALADQHMDEAVALGSDDPLAPTALFGCRFARLRAQERAREALEWLDEEEDVLQAIPEAECFQAALRGATSVRVGELGVARELLPAAARTLAFDDPGFMCFLAETAVAVGDLDLCQRLAPLLEARAHRFVSGGPMFMYVADPVERYLGLVKGALGDRAAAALHLESALARLREAKSGPFLARAALDLARLFALGTPAEQQRADALRAEAFELAQRYDLVDLKSQQPEGPTRASTAPRLPVSPGFQLACEGDTWAVTSGARTFRLRDSRGLRILARLVEHAGEELHALDLVDGPAEGSIDRGDAGELLDARARAEYRARLVDLREDLVEAEERGDLGWTERLRSEIEVIQRELARAVGRGGRARRSGAAAERARSAVTRRVRDAISRIREHDPTLGEHLDWAVRTGLRCSYQKT